MPEPRSFLPSALLRRTAVLLGLALLPTPALAQYIGGTAPPLPAPPRPGEVQTPAAALARAVRVLAQSPRDFTALIAAGRAALDLGDTQAAIGFFGRAEEVRPSDPAPKIGMGAATVVTGDADGALRWFYEAQRLGATSATLGADRGLAQDLLGNQGAAQLDYRAALGGREADEARRRLALSLGISGDRTGAFTALQPLLQRRDPAAQRVRAFVLALVGDERGASSAIDQAMPGTGSRMAGFFRLLPNLSAPQKAAAVHLGVFPDPSEIRVAAVTPRVVAAPPQSDPAQRAITVPPRPALTAPAPAQPSVTPAPAQRLASTVLPVQRPALATAPAVADPTPLPLPPPALASAAPGASPTTIASISPDPQAAVTDPVAQAVKVATLSTPAPPVSAASNENPADVPAPASPVVAMSGDRLSGIDLLLAQADELPVPPAPRPIVETPKAKPDSVSIKKVADAKKAADAKKLADAAKAAERKKEKAEEAERGAIGLSGTNWVQLAGGSHADRMGAEFRRLADKSAALKKRGGAVTAGKDYFRLLTGPFASKGAAQDFVNQLAKDGVDGFSWTRTPATLRIEKIPPK